MLYLCHVLEIVDSETVWRALASPHRRMLLDLLREGPQTTGQLVRQMPGLSRFAVMQHLGVLAEAGLVLIRREGRQRFNYVNPIPLREIYERWVNRLSSSAAETALHLKRYAETTHEVAKLADQDSYRLVRIEMELRIRAPRERVFAAITDELDNWWPHRYKPDSKIVVDSRVGGMIEERFANGGGAQYGSIAYIDPPSVLMTTGPSALNRGQYSFNTEKLEQDGEYTIVKREMQIWGTVSEEVEKMFREGTRMLMENALRQYCESGVRYTAEVTP